MLIRRLVLNIASNNVERLTHGWFAVRNRTTKEISEGVVLRQRHLNEKRFFGTSPWNTLAKDRTGIASLRKFLGKLLYNHIGEEFPALVEDLRKLVVESRSILDALGAPRQTSVQQRQFLLRLAERYQQLVTDSLRGAYDSTWDAQDVRRLRMHMHSQNEKFTTTMRLGGHRYVFRENDQADDFWPAKKVEDIHQWIRTTYRESRGSELPGTINPTVLEGLFRQQAREWRSIAQKHINTIDEAVNNFNKDTWLSLVSEPLREKVQALNFSASSAARLHATQQLEGLLQDELGGILQTVNHYYAENIAAARAQRMRERLKAIGFEEGSALVPDFAKVLGAAQLSNEDQAVQDIHDTLRAYYKVALKRFSDNVVLQCIERSYVGTRGPVKTISPARIGEMSDNELADRAAENYVTSSQRIDTSHRLTRLEKALELAEKENK